MVQLRTEPCWLHFDPQDLKYDGTTVYSTCKYCKPTIPPALLTELAALFQTDKKLARKRAREANLIIGRKREMSRHLKSDCKQVPESVKEWAKGHLSLKKVNTDAPKENVGTTNESNGILSSPGSKRSLQQTGAEDNEGGKKRNRRDEDAHHRIIAEMVCCYKIPYSFFESPRFRRLQRFYTGGRDPDLQIDANKIRQVVIPARFDEAMKNNVARIQKCGFDMKEFTIHDGWWVSLQKPYSRGMTIGRPSSGSHTVAVYAIEPSELHGPAIAKKWEDILASSMNPQIDGFFASLPRAPSSFSTDDSGANRRARRIAALRHPDLIFFPCMAHQFAFMCGDILTKCTKSSSIANSMFLVQFFNSSSKWLPRLRNEVRRLSGDSMRSLDTSVVTRWTGMWLSAVSVLRNKDAFSRVLTHRSAQGLVDEAKQSRNPELAAARRMIQIVSDSSFWIDLERFVEIQIPSIEASVLMQSQSCTLGDVLYCFGRLYQGLYKANEFDVIDSLESRFKRYEFPLLFLSFYFHPKYWAKSRCILEEGLIDGEDVVTWTNSYFKRWFSKRVTLCMESNVSRVDGCFRIALEDWHRDGPSAMGTRGEPYPSEPGGFWERTYRDNCAQNAVSTTAASFCGLALVARRLFSVSPNGADPEKVFSEIGRLLVRTRASFSDAQSSQMKLICDDVSTREREKIAAAVAAGTRTAKQDSEKDRAVAVLKKCESVFSGKTLGEKLRGSRVSNVPADVSAGDCETNEGEIVAELLDYEGYDVAEGVEPVIDDEVTARAVLDFAQFKKDLIAAMEIDDIQGDANEKTSCLEDEEALRDKSHELYEELSDVDDAELPEDAMAGFRGAKVPLSRLFNSSAIGLLPSVSKLGRT